MVHRMKKKVGMKYYFGWSELKVTEGGLGSEPFKSAMKKFRQEHPEVPVRTWVGGSPYVGQTAVNIQTATKGDMLKVLKFLKKETGYGFSTDGSWIQPIRSM